MLEGFIDSSVCVFAALDPEFRLKKKNPSKKKDLIKEESDQRRRELINKNRRSLCRTNLDLGENSVGNSVEHAEQIFLL